MKKSNESPSQATRTKEIFKLPDACSKFVISRIVGENGKRLREIEKMSGIKTIRMKRKGGKDVIHIIGTEKQRKLAKNDVMSIIVMPQTVVPVPQDAKGCVIGTQRRKCNEIMQKTGVRLKMEDDGAHLTGTEEGIKMATRMIEDIIEKKLRWQERQNSHPEETILSIPKDKKGLVIGTKGCTIKGIEQETGAKIRIEVDGAHVQGTCEQRRSAEEKINEVLANAEAVETKNLEGCTKVFVPVDLIGVVIGKDGEKLKRIQIETGTNIQFRNDGYFYVKGESDKNEHKAKLKIKEVASGARINSQGKPRCKKFSFVDGFHIGKDNELKLELVDNPHPRWLGKHYKLTLTEEPTNHGMESFESEETLSDGLSEKLLKVLVDVQQEKEKEAGNLRVDMWCHFGHVYIADVDEEEEGEIFDLQTVRKKFKHSGNESSQDATWRAMFTEGIEKLEFESLEESLSDRPYKVPPNIRHDFSFLTPSCRQIRMKAFLEETGEGQDGDLRFYEQPPIPIKNVLAHEPNYYLCAPSSTWLKLDIFIPSLLLDCHLVLRTTLKTISKTPEEEEEQKILIDYLQNHLKIQDSKLVLSQDTPLPTDFDLSYWRRSKRRSYGYSSGDGEDFTVMISEEQSEDVEDVQPGAGSLRCNTDFHLHCDEWDRLLFEGDWEPQQIVSKFNGFLSFVRNVQQNVSVPELKVDED